MATCTGRLDEPAPVTRRGRGLSNAARGLKDSTLGRFLVVGGVSYLVNQALLFLLYEGVFGEQDFVHLGPLRHLDGGLMAASAIAMEVSILVRFLLNDTWTFRGRAPGSFAMRLLQSNLSSLGSPVIAVAAVNLMTPLLGISYLVANSAGIALGLVWNWAWSSRVIWRLEPAHHAPIAMEEAR
ncbi:MAG: GtrA family protein [Dehalococcoidia bacterium]